MQEMEQKVLPSSLNDNPIDNPDIDIEDNEDNEDASHSQPTQEIIDPGAHSGAGSCGEKFKMVLYGIKEYILPLVVIMSCCPNFSYVNLPLTFIGFFSPFISIFKFKWFQAQKTKLFIEGALLIYSSICLIFKIIIVSLSIKWTSYMLTIFKNIGVPAIENPSNAYLMMITFIGESFVIGMSIFALLITYYCHNPHINNTITAKKYKILNHTMIWIMGISIILLTSFNNSYLSIFITIKIHLLLFIWAMSQEINPTIQKAIYIQILLVLFYQLSMTHFANIYDYIYTFDEQHLWKYLLAYTGILKLQNDSNPLILNQIPVLMKGWVSYFLLASSIILLFLSLSIANKQISILNEDNNNNPIELRDSSILISDIEIKKKDSICKILCMKLGEYLISPSFILHFCRVGIIIWTYSYKNYESIVLLLWLFASFLVVKVEKISFVSKYITFPVMILTTYLFQAVNIPEGYMPIPSDPRQRIILENYGFHVYRVEVAENLMMQFIIILFILLIKAVVTTENKERYQLMHDYSGSNNFLRDILIEEDKDEEKDKMIDEDIEKHKKDFSFTTLIIKCILENIDKITLVCMYFVTVDIVNVSHFLMTIVLMIQLLSPKSIKNICYGILIFIEMIYSMEYICHLCKVYIPQDKEGQFSIFKFIKFFTEYSSKLDVNSIEIRLFLPLYCFYLQYQNYNNPIYQKIAEKKVLTLESYLNRKLEIYPLILKYLLIVINIILEFYVWVLIIFCFFFQCYFEINLLFNIKFALFLILCYQFLISIQNNGKKFFNSFGHWVFMIYCMINTLIVYFYQFGKQELIEKEFNNFIHYIIPFNLVRDNLGAIGLQLYEYGKLQVKFLPHFAMNFLSVLFYWETMRIGEKAVSDKTDRNVNKLLNIKNLHVDKEHKQEKVKEIQEEPIDEEEIKKINRRYIFSLKFKYYLCQAIILFTKVYWLLLFLSIFIIYTTYSLSLSMIIYILIFGLSFIVTFKRPVNLVSVFLSDDHYLLSKQIRYNMIEFPNMIRNSKINRKISFRYLLAFSLLYIILTYTYAVFDIIQNGCESPLWDCNISYKPIIDETLEDYFQAISYLCGVYANIRNMSFFKCIWVHLFLIAVISFDVYLQKMQNYLSKVGLDIDRLLKQINVDYVNQMNILDIQKALINDDLNGISGSRAASFSSKKRSFGDSINLQKHEKTSDDILELFTNMSKRIHEKEKPKAKEKNQKIAIMKSCRAILEEVIILMLVLTAISKLSIWSFIYMLLFLFFFFTTYRTVKMFYCLLIFLVCFIILQAALFLSNLSTETSPIPDLLCLILIKKNLSLPWYSTLNLFNDAWGFSLGIGVNKQQTALLWMDFITVVIIYFYLDNFCFSIYQNVPNRGSKADFNCNINYHNLTSKKKLTNNINNLSEEEYAKHAQTFLDSFGIRICSYEQLKEYFKIKIMDQGDLKKALLGKMKSKIISRPENVIKSSTKIFYLSMHNIVLIIIVILSIMVSGLISAIYITFSLVYLLDSASILMGKKSRYPKGVKTTLRTLIICDIILQLIVQLPTNIYLNNFANEILKTIGINQIMKYVDPYQSNTFTISSNEMFLVNVKAVTYFIMSLQVYIYSSKEFQEFYFSYIIKKNTIISRRAFVEAFLFNNRRIDTMNDNIEKRIHISKTMTQLEKSLEKWSHQLNMITQENGVKAIEEVKEGDDDANEDKMKKEEEIDNTKVKEEFKAYMLGGIMMSLYLWLHKNNTNYSYIGKKQKREFESNIIKGKTKIRTNVEREVDEFIENMPERNFAKEELFKVFDAYLSEKPEKDKEKNKKKEPEGEVVDNQGNRISKMSAGSKTLKSSRKIKEGRISSNKPIVKAKSEMIDEDEPIISSKQRISHPIHDLKNIVQSEHKILEKNHNEILKLLKLKIKRKRFNFCFLFSRILGITIIYFMNNSHYICFLIMIINNSLNCSMISLFYPIVVFGFGLISYPRPSKAFWKICLYYSTSILIIKYAIQLHFIQKDKIIFNFMIKYKIGLVLFESTFSVDFFIYIVFDALIVFLVLIQQYILISKGLWEDNENAIESIKRGHERIFKANIQKNIVNVREFNDSFLAIKSKGKRHTNSLNIYHSSGRPPLKYHERVFTTTRNEKPGANYYIYFTIPLILIIVYLIVFYTSMEQDKTNGFNNITDVTSNSIKQFSGTMVIFVVIHVILAVWDRIIYIRQNRNNLKFDYLYFDKTTGKRVSESLRKVIKEKIRANLNITTKEDFEIPLNNYEELSKEYNIVFIQKEQTNFPLISKYILHWLTVIFSHILIFFYLPMKGNYNLTNSIVCESNQKSNIKIDFDLDLGIECNEFTSNYILIIFYCLYLLYLFYSAQQIRFGYLDMRDKSLLKSRFSSIDSIIFKSVKAIPFLYELKLAIDWTFTTTCLDIFQWNKFEKIYDVLYTTTCTMKFVDSNPVGNKIGKILKLGMGGSIFSFILLLLIVPLFIFSSLNPTNQLNKVTGAATNLVITFKQLDDQLNSYPLFENKQVESIIEINDTNGKDWWKRENYSNISITKNFPKEQVQRIKLSTTSDVMWDIATPHKDSIIENLNKVIGEKDKNIKAVYLGYEYSLIRPYPPETKDSIKKFNYVLYEEGDIIKKTDKVFKKDILIQLTEGMTKCQNTKIILPEFYKPGVRLFANPKPKVILECNTKDIIMGFDCAIQGNQKAAFFTLALKEEPKSGIEFHAFSDKVSTSTGTSNVITFFTTYVLLIGMYLGNFFAGEAEKVILTEMPEPGKLVTLCEGIQISRYSFQLEKEEYLYYMLIEFMRSPEYLRMLTKASLEKFKDRKKRLNDKMKQEEKKEGNSDNDEGDREEEDLIDDDDKKDDDNNNGNNDNNDNDKDKDDQQEDNKDGQNDDQAII